MTRATTIFFLSSLLLMSPATATSPPASDGAEHLASGFKEAVFSVRDLDAAIEVYRAVAGWEIVLRGDAGADQARFWHLDPGQKIEQVLMRNPGDDEGLLRLVRFPGTAPRLMRPGAQTWDTGGIFDVNVRVLDAEAKLVELQAHGWQSYSEVVEFRFGKFVVREVLAKGPDGIVFALIERVQPALEGYDNLRHFSHIFNSTQLVRDFDRSFDFFTRQLGFEVYLKHEGPSREAGPSVLGLPQNLTTEIPRKVAIVSPRGDNFGSVEILSFEGATGNDYSDRASAPNLGHLTLRFPVADLDAYLQQIQARGVETVSGPAELQIEPYGKVRAFAVRAPEGAWLEFVELPEVTPR